MNENFLHFIWKFQKFNSALETTDGETVAVFFQGNHNHDDGPDFADARIQVGEIEWNGQVEIHIKSSDWDHHNHTEDSKYNTVILHVVWSHDREIVRADGSHIPTVELKKFVNPNLASGYTTYLNQPSDILCHAHLPSVSDITWKSNLERMLAHRLERKSQTVLDIALESNYDWEEAAYQVLGRNFGFSLNADNFQQLAKKLSSKILAKHGDNPNQIEALIFGQAGFLGEESDSYQLELKNEYDFLKKKYKLSDNLHRLHWRFGKMRPSNFPTVRLAQFSSILSVHQKLFSLFSGIASVQELKSELTSTLSPYWQNHYDFNKPLKKGSNALGRSSFENLIINSVAPLLSAYSLHTDQPIMMKKAVTLLEQLKPEKNRFTNKFTALNRKAKSAFDSQAQITLYQDFCAKKNCLNCGIGSWIFNK